MESNLRQSVKNAQTAIIREPMRMDFVEGVSPSMRSVEAVMREVAQSEVPVLLLAERGAGKKATARRVHDLSHRRGQSFRVVSCATLESDKFADLAGQGGLLGEGTVFLEEAAELSAEGQAWLIQALTRGNANVQGPARLICGSARDLEAEVRAGNLREDLYYRFSGVCLRIPPLRQRREDIPILMEHFLRKYGHDFQRTVPALSEETHRLFQVTTPFGADTLLFGRMQATERLSQPFEFIVTAFSERGDLDADTILGKAVTVKIATQETPPRYFQGLAADFTLVDYSEQLYEYRVTLRPWLWFLTQTADCRTFLNKSVPDIVQEVCKQAGRECS